MKQQIRTLVFSLIITILTFGAHALGGEPGTTSTAFKGVWNMDQVEGNSLLDSAGNFNGLMVEGMEQVDAFKGKGLSFNSGDMDGQYVEVDHLGTANPASLSVECYVRLNDPGERSDYRILFKDQEYDIHIWHGDPKGVSLRFMFGTSDMEWRDVIVARPGNMMDGGFHHLGFSYNADKGEFIGYWDRQVLTIISIPNTGTRFTDHKLYIGAGYWENAPQQCFSGIIDQLVISDRVVDFRESPALPTYIPDEIPLGDYETRNSQVIKRIHDQDVFQQITGSRSPNRTDRYDLWGTDLGSPVEMNGRFYLLFGDTFGDPKPDENQVGIGGHPHHNWRSNTIGITLDYDLSDGLTMGAAVDENFLAYEFIPSAKVDMNEVTTIPTGAFSVGDTLYAFYMSVKHWGPAGVWDSNYGGLAKSVDYGRTWEKLVTARWPGNGNFIMTSCYKTASEVYIWGIGSGRFTGVKLMKARLEDVEQASCYQYFKGEAPDGKPLWSSNMAEAQQIVPPAVGELSVIWNSYLNRWIMTYLDDRVGEKRFLLRESYSPWGPWSPPQVFASFNMDDWGGPDPDHTVPIFINEAIYAPFMHPTWMEENGRVIYFLLSHWSRYNVCIGRMEFELKPVSSLDDTNRMPNQLFLN